MHTDFAQVELKHIGGDRSREILRATSGSAGYDLCAARAASIKSGERYLMGTGIGVHIQHNLYCGIVCMRSGTAHKKGLRLSNGIGVIDSDYLGEIKLSLHNTSLNRVVIDCGERIAQLLFIPVAIPELIIVEQFTEDTDRGAGGFGSSDKNAIRDAGVFRVKIPSDKTVYHLGGRAVIHKHITNKELLEIVPDVIATVGWPPVKGDKLHCVCDELAVEHETVWVWDGVVWNLTGLTEANA